ncbi:hypothetical protein CDD80_2837 [Ophiocordyceps camponoti-rufipedis]|uniref:Malonyl-CoA:ACP transacylase (MAT) domain-containing protein n=1 Tax=Ophiocordyceps camponoti-rufipedis TaxID=2004952 RepID=A0A2C5Z609_9HYPO|nr:hypothetical protein CDD80_2837 [Ophiocordyceps camponoti-rufipedis]
MAVQYQPGLHQREARLRKEKSLGIDISRINAAAGPSSRLIPLSSPSPDGLKKVTATLETLLQQAKTQDSDSDSAILDRLVGKLMAEGIWTCWRSFALASSPAELLESQGLGQLVRVTDRHVVCFIFTGSGAQWFNMGRELLRFDVFRRSLEASGRILEEMGCEWSLFDEMYFRDEPRIDEPGVFQPAVTALQIALADLVKSWNVRPGVVVGHSSGEIAAAFVKGAISRRSALKIAFVRGLVSHHISKPGGMLAVGLGEEAVKPVLEEVRQEGHYAVVGCTNSPRSVTVSGDDEALAASEAALNDKGVFHQRVRVSNAYHSGHVDEVADEYRDALTGLDGASDKVETDESDVVMFSSLTGKEVRASQLREPSYWVSNLRDRVRFSEAVQGALRLARKETAAEKEDSTAVLMTELGPHPALRTPLRQTFQCHGQSYREKDSTQLVYGSLLARNRDAVRTTLETMGQYFQWGYVAPTTAVG